MEAIDPRAGLYEKRPSADVPGGTAAMEAARSIIATESDTESTLITPEMIVTRLLQGGFAEWPPAVATRVARMTDRLCA
jgi:hypothetical protein